MHTFVVRERTASGVVASGDVRVFHDGDWLGTAEVQWSEGVNVHRAKLPAWVVTLLLFNRDADPLKQAGIAETRRLSEVAADAPK